MDPIKVLIVDDEALFSELLSNTLSSEPGIEVLGVARDGESAIRFAREHKPDAVLMDIELPGELDGIDAALAIKQEKPDTGIVILSAHSNRRYVTSLPLEESSGWAYLLKQSVQDVATLIHAIKGSSKGMIVLDPTMVANLRPRKGSAVAELSPRQQEVLELVVQGHNNAGIAQRLVLTEKAVEGHINAIYQELHLSGEEGVHARVRATLLYLQESQNRQ